MLDFLFAIGLLVAGCLGVSALFYVMYLMTKDGNDVQS